MMILRTYLLTPLERRWPGNYAAPDSAAAYSPVGARGAFLGLSAASTILRGRDVLLGGRRF